MFIYITEYFKITIMLMFNKARKLIFHWKYNLD